MESVAALSGHFSSISFDLFSILQLLLLMNNKKMWVYRIKHPKMTCRGGHFTINVLCPNVFLSQWQLWVWNQHIMNMPFCCCLRDKIQWAVKWCFISFSFRWLSLLLLLGFAKVTRYWRTVLGKKTNQKREGGGKKKSTTRNYVRGFGGRGGSGGDKLCKDRLYKSEK